MSKSKQEELNNPVVCEYQEKFAPLIQDVRDPAMNAHYDSLDGKEYLDVVWNEMKTMFSMCDFESRKNEPTDFFGDMGIPYNQICWPVDSSQLLNYSKIDWGVDVIAAAESLTEADLGKGLMTELELYHRSHMMVARHKGRFSLKNAVIRARFIGDDTYHTFYIGEHDMLNARVCIYHDAEMDRVSAFMVDGRIPESETWKVEKLLSADNSNVIYRYFAVIEEFYMLAVTNGRYYKDYMKPREVNDDLAIFTCYNRNRKLCLDTVASFKDGLCDPATIFVDDGTEDIQILF